MRYFLSKKLQHEIKYRKDYLKNVTKVWFIEKGTTKDFIILESFPSTYYDNVCLIYGHNNKVHQLFDNDLSNIPETYIFIFSCRLDFPFKAKNKKIFLAPQTGNYMKTLKKNFYNFPFDISEVEINLYNSQEENLLKKLKTCFNMKNSIN